MPRVYRILIFWVILIVIAWKLKLVSPRYNPNITAMPVVYNLSNDSFKCTWSSIHPSYALASLLIRIISEMVLLWIDWESECCRLQCKCVHEGKARSNCAHEQTDNLHLHSSSVRAWTLGLHYICIQTRHKITLPSVPFRGPHLFGTWWTVDDESNFS